MNKLRRFDRQMIESKQIGFSESRSLAFGRSNSLPLVTRKGGRLVLTEVGRLKSISLSESGVNVGTLIEGGQTPLEKQIMQLLSRVRPGLLTAHKDPLKALCILRVIHIPNLCYSLIRGAEESEEDLIWLGPLATYVLAFIRTMYERKWRNRGQIVTENRPGSKKLQIKKWEEYFRGPVIEWFDEAPEDFLFWMERFDAWRRQAELSWDYYISKQSIDIRRMKGKLREAAMLGVFKKLNGLPERWFRHWEQSILGDPDTGKVFRRNARKSRILPKPPSLERDTWLIEIWPLVLQYGWNWHDLRRVYNCKFMGIKPGELQMQKVTLAEVKQLKERCKESLDLHLGPSARLPGRRKRLPIDVNALLPRMAGIALGVTGIGKDSDSWVLGQIILRLPPA
jgi:hypothetical protein